MLIIPSIISPSPPPPPRLQAYLLSSKVVVIRRFVLFGTDQDADNYRHHIGSSDPSRTTTWPRIDTFDAIASDGTRKPFRPSPKPFGRPSQETIYKLATVCDSGLMSRPCLS